MARYFEVQESDKSKKPFKRKGKYGAKKKRGNATFKKKNSGPALRRQKRTAEDPFPGKAPIPKEKLQKYQRGTKLNNKKIRTKFHQKKFVKKEKKIELVTEDAARSELLLPEESGFLEAEAEEVTRKVTQQELAAAVDITSATKYFDLHLMQFGPYQFDYTRNGRHLLLGGRRGHVAAIDWVTKKLLCEINVMEEVQEVKWLHQETMFSVAQKDWVYIYDNEGTELHCVKKLDRILRMEFLPYHFLLATSNEKSFLSWLDVSIGQMVTQYPTRMGRLDVMCQNPANAVIVLGHPKGLVTMWSPNLKEPLVKMLCHQHPIRAVSVDTNGIYMATTAIDRSLKIWDVRTFKCLQSYKLGAGASNLSFSQKGLLGASLGNIVEVYQDCCIKPMSSPYMRHVGKESISSLKFCPYEDVLGIGHYGGFTSILVPGAGEPNFDTLESNPFQTKSQRREAEVKSLLEKIQPDMISLNPMKIGRVDVNTLKEKLEEKEKIPYVKKSNIEITPKKKKGRSKSQRKNAAFEEEKRKTIKEAINKKKTEDKKIPKQKQNSVLDRFIAKK